MPGHDHTFHEFYPSAPLATEETFLNWACPVKDKDTIETSLDR